MPHPKKRKSKTRTNTRRSHHALKNIKGVVCGKCGADMMPHCVCSHCGFYKGKEIKK